MLKEKSLNTRDALRAAASKGCLAALRFLVEEGVSKTDADKQGQTPLMLATQNNHENVVRFLKRLTDKDNDKYDMLLTNKELNTCDALRAAARRSALGAVRFLVEEGVSKDDGDCQGCTALYLASLYGRLAVVQYLLDQGADKDKPLPCYGASPLYIAAQNGHLAVVQHMLERGADKDKAKHNGDTALLAAAEFDQLSVVQCLLEYGADVNKCNDKGVSSLFIAAENGNLAVVQCLLEYGADKNKCNDEGESPLYTAAKNDNPYVFQCLQEHGAKVSVIPSKFQPFLQEVSETVQENQHPMLTEKSLTTRDALCVAPVKDVWQRCVFWWKREWTRSMLTSKVERR